jgi:hypothetical protein
MDITEVKIKCVKDIGPFKKDQYYYAETRSFTNKNDKNDVQVIIIESSEGDVDNCYLMPLKTVYEHFSS